MANLVIVDDSSTVRDSLKQVLSGAGHTVVECENGNDGFDKITNGKVDLVISDYNMPGLDGLAMLTKIKDKLGTIGFPIFMLTTESSEKLKNAGKEIGVTAWITKPFTPEKLLAAVSKVLQR